MGSADEEDMLLRSVALQNAQAILAARQRDEEALREANVALEIKSNELAHSLAMVRATLHATTDAILVTDDAGNITECNEKYCRFWNAPAELLAPRKHRPLLEFIAARFADPDGFIARVDEIYALSPPETVDVLELADGKVYERHSRVQFVDGSNAGRVWTFRDITEQRRVEDALREDSRVLELLNKTGAAIASKLELESLIQEITDAATELSGAKLGAFFYNSTGPGGDVLMLYTLSGAPREAFERFGQPRATALFGPTFRGEPPIRHDDILTDARYGKSGPHHGMPKGHFPVRSYLAVPVISRSGQVIGGLFFGHPEVAVFTARTERVIVGIAAQAAVAIDNARLYEAAQKAATERASLLQSEQNARQVAEQQNRSKDAFLAMLGHELRNPLSAISAGVAVINTAAPASDIARRANEIIGRQSGHLERIVDDLLDTARMLAGKISLKKGRVDLGESVNACIQALQTAGKADGYRFNVSLQPAVVDADSARIDQIINNLVTNALKYTPGGGRITVSVSVAGLQAILEVSDNGIGIPEDLIDRVFDPFVQGERSIDRSQGGLGIGLTLVRELAELHGGSAAVTSRGEGCGSAFTVRLPLADIAAVAITSTQNARRLQQASILIIEDNPDALEMTSAMLEQSNYQVFRAKNGTEGMECAKTRMPDVVIIDIGLPDVSGYDVARHLRSCIGTSQMRLIALTGYGSPEDVATALAAGFEVHIVKPVNFTRLISAIERPVEQV